MFDEDVLNRLVAEATAGSKNVVSVVPEKIYVCGPYSATTEVEIIENVHAAIDAGIAIFLKGHYPYIPHLNMLVDDRAWKHHHIGFVWQDWMRWDDRWLDECDSLYYIRTSKGADIELGKAKQTGKKIYFNLDEIPEINQDSAVISK